jgi:FkbM family methyltransferase
MLSVRNGPLKGKKWIAFTGSRFILGTYEPFKTAAILENVHQGDVVYDVGAHVGYYSAIASMLVGPRGQVIAFEPRPLNIQCLKQHVRVNRLSNVQIVESCVGDRPGPCRFETRTGTGTGHVSDHGDLHADMVSLDNLFGKGDLPEPDFLKIDVEGGETAVLKGARQVVQKAHPILLVATHGVAEHAFVTEFLGQAGYQYAILDPQGGKGDTEILAKPIKKEPR